VIIARLGLPLIWAMKNSNLLPKGRSSGKPAPCLGLSV